MTLPTRTPILPAPARRPAATAATILVSSVSVASSSARRLRARSGARAGVRHATRRSAGECGWVISARLAWSNRVICNGPSSAARAAIAGARSAVTQPNPPSSRKASTRALVIIPRSPTITMSVSLNVSRTASTMALNAVGSAVLPGNTRTATGRPAGSVNSPYSICGSPFLPSREYPRAARGQHRPVTQEEDRSNKASGAVGVGWPAQVGADQLGLDGVLASGQPVHRRVHLIGGGVGHAQVRGQRGVGPPARGGQLRTGSAYPGDDQGQRDVPFPPSRPE